MSRINERAFARAFRFHPRSWREHNEAVALGVLIEVAEAAGRHSPSTSERLSLAQHAALIWIDRAISRRAREILASLALGTGIALSLAYYCAFTLVPRAAGIGPVTSSAPWSGGILTGLCLAAALALTAQSPRGARRLLAATIVVAATLGALKLWNGELALPSMLNLGLVALWAAVACLGGARPRNTWIAAAIVATLSGIALAYAPLVAGSSRYVTDGLFWENMSPWILCALSVWFLWLGTAALTGRSDTAIAGTAYAAPWAVLMLAGYAASGIGAAEHALITAAWLGLSALVLALAHTRSERGKAGSRAAGNAHLT